MNVTTSVNIYIGTLFKLYFFIHCLLFLNLLLFFNLKDLFGFVFLCCRFCFYMNIWEAGLRRQDEERDRKE